MKIIITEEQKNKLFIPRKLSGEGSRWEQWNNEQPIIDGKRINQYDSEGRKIGYWENYYDNGQLQSKGNYKDGKQDGYWEYYWGNGNLWGKGNFINDIKDGYWEEYYSNGNLYIKGNYLNGDKDGYWEFYHYNGYLHSKGSYMVGVMEGIWEYYWDNGQLGGKGNFINDKKEGIWKHYDENGKLLIKREYSLDNIIKTLPLTESNKLFIPRKIDEREEQFNNDIKKFLNSIKDSFVWGILSKIQVAYNFESDWPEISYYNKNGVNVDGHIFKYELEKIYGSKYSIQDFNKSVDSITGFMDDLIYGGDNIMYSWCEIKYLGDGHLEFEQHKEIKITEQIIDIEI